MLQGQPWSAPCKPGPKSGALSVDHWTWELHGNTMWTKWSIWKILELYGITIWRRHFYKKLCLLSCQQEWTTWKRLLETPRSTTRRTVDPLCCCEMSTLTDPWCAGDSGNQKSTGEKHVGRSLVQQLQTERVDLLVSFFSLFLSIVSICFYRMCCSLVGRLCRSNSMIACMKKSNFESRQGEIRPCFESKQEPGFGTIYS